jgi:capsule polysaccharide export protein KpsC/LpsZ
MPGVADGYAKRLSAMASTNTTLGILAIPVLPAQALGKRIILVIGQVEDDASVRIGSTLVKGNDALLAATRCATGCMGDLQESS